MRNTKTNNCCSSCYKRKSCVGCDWYCRICEKQQDKCKFANMLSNKNRKGR